MALARAIPLNMLVPQKPILIFLTPDPHKGFGPARDHTELQKNAFPPIESASGERSFGLPGSIPIDTTIAEKAKSGKPIR